MAENGDVDRARRAAQVTVINAIGELVRAEPARCTGVVTDGAARVTVYVVDPAMSDDDRLRALLDDARAEDIDIAVVTRPRSLHDLTAVEDAILRTAMLRDHGVRAAELWIDPAAAVVAVRVAESVVDLVRRLLAHHGDAVVVSGTGPIDLGTRLPRHHGSRAGWPVPSLAPDDAAGLPADRVAERYRSAGFEVETFHLGDPEIMTLDLRTNRIRLLVHDGIVIDAVQS